MHADLETFSKFVNAAGPAVKAKVAFAKLIQDEMEHISIEASLNIADHVIDKVVDGMLGAFQATAEAPSDAA